METAHMHLGKPWKRITYHTSSFAMPTAGMCSPFKTNSGHCQSPHCFRCWWFILWLAWGWREEKERTREQERGYIFIPNISLSSASLEIRVSCPTAAGSRTWATAACGAGCQLRRRAAGTRRNTTTLLFTMSPLVPPPEAPTDWDATSPFLPRELHLPSKFTSNVLAPCVFRHHSLCHYSSLLTHLLRHLYSDGFL